LATETEAASVPVAKILTDVVENGRTLHEWITSIDARVYTLVHDVYAPRKMLEDDQSKGEEGADTLNRPAARSPGRAGRAGGFGDAARLPGA